MNEAEFTTFLNTLALAVSSELTEFELSLVAAALTQIGDTLATIAVLKSQREFNK